MTLNEYKKLVCKECDSDNKCKFVKNGIQYYCSKLRWIGEGWNAAKHYN